MSQQGVAQPRTLLEALVRQRRWSHRDFCMAYARAGVELGLVVSISQQHAGRWLGGRLKGLPYPSQCRVLEHMFEVDALSLFGPAVLGRRPGLGATTAGTGEPGEEVWMAAQESARFAERVEQTNVGPHTLDQFAADIRRIVTVYPNRPVYPLFVELRSLRDRAFEKLEGRQFPGQSRDLYLVAGTVMGVLANASFDLGRLDCAETQARTAFLCAELAGVNWLRAWLRGTQALVAYWDERPLAAVRLAEDGRQYVPESGTAAVRLASIQARAHGMLRDPQGVDTALGLAEDARTDVIRADETGGMMSFPMAKQQFYASTARLWLGDSATARIAETDATQAVRSYESDPPEERRLGELNLARLDLVTARLALDEADGVVDGIRPVLEVAERRPIDSVTRRLRQVHAALGHPRYAGSAVLVSARDQIQGVIGPARPAVHSGTRR